MPDNMLDKFLRYVAIDTQSKEDSESYPSTTKQFDLLNLLLKELKDIGVPQANIDEHGYVMATIPSNVSKPIPTLGFIAHVDTSPEVSGANVKPQIIKEYKGGDIVLPGDSDIIIRESENPALKSAVGKMIVTSDGTTLLGADDKAKLFSGHPVKYPKDLPFSMLMRKNCSTRRIIPKPSKSTRKL